MKFAGFMFKRPEGGSQRFEIRRFLGNYHPGNLIIKILDHHTVAGRTAGDHNVLSFHLF